MQYVSSVYGAVVWDSPAKHRKSPPRPERFHSGSSVRPAAAAAVAVAVATLAAADGRGESGDCGSARVSGAGGRGRLLCPGPVPMPPMQLTPTPTTTTKMTTKNKRILFGPWGAFRRIVIVAVIVIVIATVFSSRISRVWMIHVCDCACGRVYRHVLVATGFGRKIRTVSFFLLPSPRW